MAKISRRKLIQSAAAAAAVAPLSSCSLLISRVTSELGQKIPDSVTVEAGEQVSDLHHLLQRTSFGIWPGDLAYLKSLGKDNWLEEQLNPSAINDTACDLRARRFESIHFDPAFCYEFKKSALRSDLVHHTLLRATYSKRQLLEVMVGFWSDHLNVSVEKGDCIYLKATDDRSVIRANALGKFKNLITASAKSPAMLVYLDGKENRKASPKDVPNENYARELLELHTLGVNGGYTQKDVMEAARCLTGWTLQSGSKRGKVFFDPALHDDGEKHVLGHPIPPRQGEWDLEKLVDIACKHPATAQHISTKLAQRFVCDPAPTSLVDKLKGVFESTEGDIKELLRCLFNSPEFYANKETKLKRPFHYIASSLRALGADTLGKQELVEYLERMGQAPFQYPTPDGYPEEAAPWVGTLLWRWNFALALTANGIKNVAVDLDRLASAIGGGKADCGYAQDKLLEYFLGRQGTRAELDALAGFIKAGEKLTPEHKSELVGLVLASPAFQRY